MTQPEWLDAARALARIERFRTIDAHELLDYAMTQAIAVTDSAFGYVYHYDESEEVFVHHAWSEQVMEHCHVDDSRVRYELKATGVWGEVVRQRRPILLNDFAGSPLLKGFPEGHIPVVRWLSAPVIVDSHIVAVVGVANKDSDYTEHDAARLMTLLEVDLVCRPQTRECQSRRRAALQEQSHHGQRRARRAARDRGSRWSSTMRSHSHSLRCCCTCRWPTSSLAKGVLNFRRPSLSPRTRSALLGAS